MRGVHEKSPVINNLEDACFVCVCVCNVCVCVCVCVSCVLRVCV